MKLISLKGIWDSIKQKFLYEIIKDLEGLIPSKRVEMSDNFFLEDAADYGIEDVAMGGNTTQVQTEGKNKLNVNKTYSVTGYEEVPISLPAGDYTISNKSITYGVASSYPLLAFRNGGTGIISRSIQSGTALQITLSDSCDSVRIYSAADYATSSGKTTTFNELMIESGSTATPYEPYTDGPTPRPDYPQPIIDVTGTQTIYDSNKNLFEIDSVASAYSYGNTYTESNGVYTINPTVTNPSLCFKLKHLIKAGTYYYSGATAGSIGPRDINGNPISGSIFAPPGIMTITKDALYLRYNFAATVGTPIILNTNTVQLEIGSTATPYTPHKDQNITLHLGDTHLRKIGNYQDVIFCNEEESTYYDGTLEDGAWYLHKEIGELTLNGTEAWLLNMTGTNTYRFSISETLLQNSSNGYCNSNIWVTSGLSSDKQLIGKLNNLLYYRINKAIIDELSGLTVDDKFKAWVMNNNIICNAPLVTFTNTKITSQNYPELYEDLQKLNKIQTHKNATTIITTADTGNNIQIEFSYKENIDKRMSDTESTILSLGANL